MPLTLTGAGLSGAAASGSVPNAEFSADINNPLGMDLVIFTDLSTNTPTSWLWEGRINAGNWYSFSTSRNPTMVPNDFSAANGGGTLAGGTTISIRLTATNAAGSDLETKAGYLVISEEG